MVGVPAFLWCAFGPSSRMYCFTCNSRSRSITQGPSSSESSSALVLAMAVRTVM
jgi:hypothetical protein